VSLVAANNAFERSVKPRHVRVASAKSPMLRLAAVVISVVVASTASADMPVREWQAQVAAKSLKSSILYLAAHQQNRDDQISGLIIALGLLQTPQADRALVALSDYYLGESTGEDTNSVITYRGKVLLPLLRAHMSKPPQCVGHIRCLTREERNDRLKIWIGFLERGDKVEFNQ
jgi:hypothetical protein